MPLPALHERFVPAAAKNGKHSRIVIARRPQADVAISGRHLQPAQGIDKNAQTNCVCSGAQRAPCALANLAAQIHWRNALKFVIARPRRGRGNLAVPGWITGKLSAKSQLPSRDCHVASLLAMTHQGGAAVHQRPPAVECPCTRRSLSAATDAIGAHHFIDTRYES